MKMRIAPLAIAIAAASTLTSTATLADGWTINGYGMTNYRLQDDKSTGNKFGRNDYLTAGTSAPNENQAELTVKKSVQYDESMYADYVLRAEYGNGESNYGSSGGSADSDSEGPFEIKEAYVLLGNLEFMPEGSQVWAGKRFMNRNAGILSGEYWKQSSGVGAGVENALSDGGKWGVSVMSADPGEQSQFAGYYDCTGQPVAKNGCGANEDPKWVPPNSGSRQTFTSYDLYVHGIKGLGGSFDFDAKFLTQADNSVDGTGYSITYNRDYYGMDGWSQTAIAFGDQLSAHGKGVNFGSWAGGGADSSSVFLTSFGVLNLTESLQLGTEISRFAGKNVYGQPELTRTLFAVRPSYMVNNNLRVEATYSHGVEEFANATDALMWGRTQKSSTFNTYEIAAALTANSDYFGRPQIKPYVTHYVSNDGAGNVLNLTDGKNSETIFGVQAEIWF